MAYAVVEVTLHLHPLQRAFSMESEALDLDRHPERRYKAVIFPKSTVRLCGCIKIYDFQTQ